MDSDGGSYHDNGCCESMWGRMQSELLYERYDTEKVRIEDVKVLIWFYFTGYWNNWMICSSNCGLPPAVRKKQYYEALAYKGNIDYNPIEGKVSTIIDNIKLSIHCFLLKNGGALFPRLISIFSILFVENSYNLRYQQIINRLHNALY